MTRFYTDDQKRVRVIQQGQPRRFYTDRGRRKVLHNEEDALGPPVMSQLESPEVEGEEGPEVDKKELREAVSDVEVLKDEEPYYAVGYENEGIHRECVGCGKDINPVSSYEVEGQHYCRSCYTRKHGGKFPGFWHTAGSEW